jgi:hypothetical protein
VQWFRTYWSSFSTTTAGMASYLLRGNGDGIGGGMYPGCAPRNRTFGGGSRDRRAGGRADYHSPRYTRATAKSAALRIIRS